MNNLQPLSLDEQRSLFKATAAMPSQLEAQLMSFDMTQRTVKPTPELFSALEHLWHLADLETEAFAVRIQRVLKEELPFLPDFAGDQLAQLRNYQSLSFRGGLRKFADARLLNLWTLSGVNGKQWQREGVQENVGRVTLAAIFRSMHEHDRAHLVELQNLQAAMRGEATVAPQSFAA